MKYVKDGNLEKMISTKFETLSISTKYNIAVQLVQGINSLHQHKIIHRDIKPENILVDKNNNVYLCDFGLASIIGKNEKIHGCCGTINFISPEIFLNQTSDLSSDIWSIGVVLYILYYGEFPFEPQNKLKLNEIIKTMITKELLFYETEVIDKKEKELNCMPIHKCLLWMLYVLQKN